MVRSEWLSGRREDVKEEQPEAGQVGFSAVAESTAPCWMTRTTLATLTQPTNRPPLSALHCSPSSPLRDDGADDADADGDEDDGCARWGAVVGQLPAVSGCAGGS